MQNLLLMIKKIPLLTWKALLVLWALFLGFMGLIFKLLDFMGQFEAANHRESDDSGFVDYDDLTAKQRHDIDSNGLSRSEAIDNPNW